MEGTKVGENDKSGSMLAIAKNSSTFGKPNPRAFSTTGAVRQLEGEDEKPAKKQARKEMSLEDAYLVVQREMWRG